MDQILIQILSAYPGVASVVLTVLSVVGILRLVLKPLMTILHSVAAATETDKDNKIIEQVEGSKIWNGLLWVLDYLASVKIKKD